MAIYAGIVLAIDAAWNALFVSRAGEVVFAEAIVEPKMIISKQRKCWSAQYRLNGGSGLPSEAMAVRTRIATTVFDFGACGFHLDAAMQAVMQGRRATSQSPLPATVWVHRFDEQRTALIKNGLLPVWLIFVIGGLLLFRWQRQFRKIR
ncbi:MAG: hypothetical protein JNJ55_07405 [Betaproteobacteria bacterium]|nr:hypothetical protein [Betaproteobacteria bacterium]